MAITFSSLPTSSATVGTPYGPSSFVATGGTGPYTYAVTAGIVPPGMALSSGGALSGTPTSGNVYTFQVTATDSLAATGFIIFSIFVSGGTAPPIGNPVALHSWDFVHDYLSTRDGAPPGQGAWTNPVTIFDGTFNGYPLLGTATDVSAGALLPTDPYGIVGLDSPNNNVFLGNGTPTVPREIPSPWQASTNPQSNFDIHYGAFPFGGALWQVTVDTVAGVGPLIIKSTDGGTTWTSMDQTHAPNNGGGPIAIQRVDNYIYLFLAVTGNNFAIYPFNMANSGGKFEPSFAPITISDFVDFHLFDTWSNSLDKFSNGDFLVCYDAVGGGGHGQKKPVCRQWTMAINTWSAAMALPGMIPGGAYANSVMDPGLSKVWIFTYNTGATGGLINCCSFTHVGSVVSSVIGTIPAITGPSSDGVNHPSIQNGMLFVPRDDQGDFANAVWVAALPTPSVFAREFLPVVTAEAGLQIGGFNQPNAGLGQGNGGTGWAIGDTFQVTGGIAGYLAEGVVNGVSAGVATSVEFPNFDGRGYTVGNNIPCIKAGTQVGSGAGLQLHITAVSRAIPSCAYMMFPNGYSLGPPPPLTLACPVNTAIAVGTPYSGTLVASGGTPPYTFSIIAGALPPGLSLNASTGVISGTPTAGGGYSYTAQVTDSLGNTSQVTCSFSVSGGGGPGGQTGTCRTQLILWQHSAAKQVEITTDRNDDWTDCGTPHSKFFQGFRLDADTFGNNKAITVRDSDTGQVHTIQPSPINHAGRQTKPYSFQTPFVAHLIRRESLDMAQWRKFGISYVWEPTPSFTYTWDTQRTSHGLSGFHHVQRMIFAYAANGPVTLTVTAFDGTSPAVITLPATGAVYQKVNIVFTFNKGLLFQYSAVSASPFQIWQNDLEVQVGEWGRQGSYINYALLGGQRGDRAEI